eukprot:scaffold143010_cov32-Attheya_sp.AAC.1
MSNYPNTPYGVSGLVPCESPRHPVWGVGVIIFSPTPRLGCRAVDIGGRAVCGHGEIGGLSGTFGDLGRDQGAHIGTGKAEAVVEFLHIAQSGKELVGIVRAILVEQVFVQPPVITVVTDDRGRNDGRGIQSNAFGILFHHAVNEHLHEGNLHLRHPPMRNAPQLFDRIGSCPTGIGKGHGFLGLFVQLANAGIDGRFSIGFDHIEQFSCILGKGIETHRA